MTNSELLSLLETAIQKRLAGDAYEEYTEGGSSGDRFRGTPLSVLIEQRDKVAAKVAAESGGVGAPTFFLAEPFDQ